MTFEQFQKSRRLYIGESKDWEGDVDADQPRFHYELDSRFDVQDAQGIIHKLHLSVLIYVDAKGEAGFDIQVQGYLHLDCFTSLEEAERKLWNHALEEAWGIDGVKEPVRTIVPIEALIPRPGQTQFVDLDELLTEIDWTGFLDRLQQWSITARFIDGNSIELVGDEDQIKNFMLENPVQ